MIRATLVGNINLNSSPKSTPREKDNYRIHVSLDPIEVPQYTVHMQSQTFKGESQSPSSW